MYINNQIYIKSIPMSNKNYIETEVGQWREINVSTRIRMLIWWRRFEERGSYRRISCSRNIEETACRKRPYFSLAAGYEMREHRWNESMEDGEWSMTARNHRVIHSIAYNVLYLFDIAVNVTEGSRKKQLWSDSYRSKYCSLFRGTVRYFH